MRTASMLGIVCVLVAPALAGPLELSFDKVSAQLTVDISPDAVANPDPVGPVNLDGTFSMTVYSDDDVIGDSDTFVLDVGDMSNQQDLKTNLASVITATIPVGSARFTDFDLAGPGHISGGTGTVSATNYLEWTMFLVGEVFTTFSSAAWKSPSVLVTFNTIGSGPTTTIEADIQYTSTFEIPITAYGVTLELDYIVEIEATAHIPEPALCSVVALGLGSAGAWLRRRRT